MKRTLFMALLLVAIGFYMTGCNEPDRWHEKDPAQGENTGGAPNY